MPMVDPSVDFSVLNCCSLGMVVVPVGGSEGDPMVVSSIRAVDVSKYRFVEGEKVPVSVTPAVVPSVPLSVVKDWTLGIPVLLGLSEDDAKVVSSIIFMVEVS